MLSSIRTQCAAVLALAMLLTSTASAAPTSTYKDAVLLHHNVHRGNHSAHAIKWGPLLAQSAQAWAEQCTFSHNTAIGKTPYGQNLLVGIPASNIGPGISDYWYNNEMPYFHWYGQANPDFSTFENYGHFSQVVWNNTKHVGCYTADCTKTGVKGVSGVGPYLTVCNYGPPGNYGGEWAQNVFRPLGAPTVH